MRYETVGYGPLAEIYALIYNSLRGVRSARRREELKSALVDLNAGERTVTFGHVTYIVEEDHGASGVTPG